MMRAALAGLLLAIALPAAAQTTVVGEIAKLRAEVATLKSALTALTARVAALEGTKPVTGSATLDWAPNTEPDLAGYRVYHGTASGSYGPAVDVGLATTYTISNLRAGTHYFTVTAYDSSGNESARAVEVSKRIE